MKRLILAAFLGLVGCQGSPAEVISPTATTQEPDTLSTPVAAEPYGILYNPEGSAELYFKFIEAGSDPLFEVLDTRRKDGARGVPISPGDHEMLGIEVPSFVWQIHFSEPPCIAPLIANSVEARVGDDSDGYDYYVNAQIEPCMERGSDIALIRNEVSNTIRYRDLGGKTSLKLAPDGAVVEGRLSEISEDELRVFVQDWVDAMPPTQRERWVKDLQGVGERTHSMDWKVRLGVINAESEVALSLLMGAYVWPVGSSLCGPETHEYLGTQMYLKSAGSWAAIDIPEEVAWSFQSVVYTPERIELLVFGLMEPSWYPRNGDGFKQVGVGRVGSGHPLVRRCE